MDQAAITPSRAAARSSSFYRFLTGLTADLIGDQIWFIVLAWLASSAADPATAATVVAVGTIPRMILLLPAGIFVDRWGALRMAQAAQVARVITMTATVPIALAEPPSIALLMVVAFIFGVADAVRLPAAGALPRWLLPTADLAKGQGLVTTAGRVSSVVSGPLTGLALAAGGPVLAVLINVVLFVAAFAMFSTLRSTRVDIPSKHQAEATGLIAGFRYVGRHRPVLSMLLVITGLNVVLIGPLNLGLVLRTQQEQWNATSLGWLLGVFGAAATVGALSLLRYKSRRRPAVVALAVTAVAGAAVSALGYTPDIWTTGVAAAVLGLSLGPAGGILVGLVQAAVNQSYLGRVMALIGFSTFGLAPIALSGFGYLVRGTSLPMAFFMAGGIVMLLAVSAAASPAVRTMTFTKATEDSNV